MKYIKYFEGIKKEPENGDYVVVKPLSYLGLLGYNICLIKTKFDNSYIINFDEKYEWWIEREDIIDWSKNKEDLEQYLSANKYNI